MDKNIPLKPLTPKQRRILIDKGTETPFSGEYDKHFATGMYRCAQCSQELFSSDHKYDAGCGWPSYFKPAGSTAVTTAEDNSHGMNGV